MQPVVKCIIIDALNPEIIVTFWSKLLDYNIGPKYGPYSELRPKQNNEIRITIQKVAQKVSGGSIHFDLKVDDLNLAENRISELGGQLIEVKRHESWEWRIMSDPEGNIFCIT